MTVAETRATFDTLPVGYRLDDYSIVEVLGKGGFGITYKAMDVRLQRHVAVKEYLPRDYAFRGDASVVLPRSEDEKEVFEWGLRRFVDEARVLALFRHPNIVAVQRFLEANGTAYLVMEYEEGEDLDRWLSKRSNVTEQQLVDRILLPILDGLEKVHTKQLLHRDIKPGNIFLRNDGSPVLIDFGASRQHGAQAATNVTSIVSAGYSPFEQYGGGNTKQGPWTDLYALAGTMYRVIAGKAPVDAIARMQGQVLTPAVDAGRGRFSEPVLVAIDRGLSLEAKDRPQSVADFRKMLKRPAGAAAAQPADDVTVVRRAPAGNARPARGGKVAMIVGALIIVIGIGAGAWYYTIGPGKKPAQVADVPETVIEKEKPPETNTTQDTAAADTSTAEQVPTTDATQSAEVPPPPVEQAAVAETQVEPEVVADPKDEDRILDGLAMPPDVRSFRTNHIFGTLLSYVKNKQAFDDCKNKCPEMSKLLENVQKSLIGPWKTPDGAFSGTIKITNPRVIQDRPDCPFLIGIVETLRHADAERTQEREYCTVDGLTRSVNDAKPWMT